MQSSIHSEFHVQIHPYRYGLAIFAGGLEAPVADSLDCFFIQSRAQTAAQMDLLHVPVRADNDPQSHCALQFLQAGRVGIVRVRVVDGSWHGHTASSCHGILTYRCALTGADATTTSLTNAATLSGTIGGQAEDA